MSGYIDKLSGVLVVTIRARRVGSAAQDKSDDVADRHLIDDVRSYTRAIESSGSLTPIVAHSQRPWSGRGDPVSLRQVAGTRCRRVRTAVQPTLSRGDRHDTAAIIDTDLDLDGGPCFQRFGAALLAGRSERQPANNQLYPVYVYVPVVVGVEFDDPCGGGITGPHPAV